MHKISGIQEKSSAYNSLVHLHKEIKICIEPIVADTKIDRLLTVANTNVTAFRQVLEANGKANKKINEKLKMIFKLFLKRFFRLENFVNLESNFF